MMTRSFDHFPPGLEMFLEPRHQLFGLGLSLAFGTFGPFLHLLEESLFVGGRLRKKAGGCIKRVGGGFVVVSVVGVLFIHAIQFKLKRLVRRLGHLPARRVQRLLMLLQRREEGRRAGEEPLLQRLQDELGGEPLGIIFRP